jgi:Xaa-Pro aminopeptidase
VPQRLAHTRELMRREGIHALLVPSADPHLSEYLPGYWQGGNGCRAFMARSAL